MKKYIAMMTALVILLAMAIVFIPGCGGPSPEEAAAQLQSDLVELQTSLLGLANPANYTSVDGVKSALKDVQTAFDKVVESAKQVKNVDLSALKSSWNDLKNAVNNISSDQPVSQQLEVLQKALQDFQDSLQRLLSTFQTSQ